MKQSYSPILQKASCKLQFLWREMIGESISAQLCDKMRKRRGARHLLFLLLFLLQPHLLAQPLDFRAWLLVFNYFILEIIIGKMKPHPTKLFYSAESLIKD